MGTRADFYVGKTEESMQYLGSIAMGGYPDGINENILRAKTEADYVKAVHEFLNKQDDASIPERDGWPWPWDNSQLTDYSYTFDDGGAWVSAWGHAWERYGKKYSDDDDKPERQGEKILFPDMTKWQKVTFGKRSGLIVLTVPKKK